MGEEGSTKGSDVCRGFYLLNILLLSVFVLLMWTATGVQPSSVPNLPAQLKGNCQLPRVVLKLLPFFPG